MIARRTLLALFGAAPALGPAVAAEAMRTGGAPIRPPSFGYETACEPKSDPVMEAIWKQIHQREREIDREQSARWRRRDSMRIAGFEAGVATHRSWSGAFRVHVQIERDIAEQKRRDAQQGAFRRWRARLLGQAPEDEDGP